MSPTFKAFLLELEESGGTLTVEAASTMLNVNPLSLHLTHGITILKSDCGAVFVPAFQFDLERSNFLAGYTELRSLITSKVSNVRICNFFIIKREWPGLEERQSLHYLLTNNLMTDDIMKYARIFASNFGTNHLL